MMKFVPLCLVLLLAISSAAEAQAGPSTVAGLPAASTANGVTYLVTDGTSLSDCATGGGSVKHHCKSNGSTWLASSFASGDISGLSSSATSDTTNAANITSGTLPAARMPALTGDVTTSVGAVATTIANSAVTATKSDGTINGIATSGAGLTNPLATTDTKLAELSLPAGYLNVSNKAISVFSHVVTITGTTQTPTYTLKLKLCTVSGCGSGTALTLLTFGATGAMTASTTVHGEMAGYVLTTTTGSSGVVESAGQAVLNTTNASGTSGILWNDTQTAGSSTINLTAALFLDIMGQLSTQSGTKNSMQARLTVMKPID